MTRTHWWLLAVTALGFGLRLAWALHTQGGLFGDSLWYTNVAEYLFEGRGYVANHHNYITEPADIPQATAYYPPLYPLTLAAWWKVAGHGITSAELLNVFLGTAAIPMVYLLGSRIRGSGVGIASAALYALIPNAIVWLPLLRSEALFTALFLLGLCALFVFDARRPVIAGASLLGALAGLAALTRGEGVLLLPIALAFWGARDGWSESLRNSAVAVVVALLVITPWTIRNWIQVDSPIPIASSSGVNLRIGHAEQATGRFLFLDDPIDGVPGFEAQLNTETEVRANGVYVRRAALYAFKHPLREAILTAQKVRWLFQSEEEMALEFEIYGGLLALSLLLAPLWLRRSPEGVVLAATIVLWIVFHVAFFSLPRFHLPLLPLVAIGAAVGLAAAREKAQQLNAPAPARGGSSTCPACRSGCRD